MKLLFNTLFKRYLNTFVSRWTILAIDCLIVFCLYPFAAIIRENFELSEIDFNRVFYRSLLALTVYLISFILFGSFKSIIRQTGLRDSFVVTQATLAAFLALLSLTILSNTYQWSIILHFSKGTLTIHFFSVLFFLLVFRFSVKSAFAKMRDMFQLKKAELVIIFGSGELGEITKQTLERESKVTYKIHCFIDDNSSKQGKKQDGTPILSPDKVLNNSFLQRHQISFLVIAINNISKERKRAIIEACMELDMQVKIVPPVQSWIQNDFSSKDIKPVVIEDLLGRASINLENKAISTELQEKIIFISGAAGSIGSEIARQVIHYKPRKVILVDNGESALYELQMEISRKWPLLFDLCDFVILDVTRRHALEELMSNVKPEIIYHAAAYKHVPLMEQYPLESVRVNILGTRNLADLACEYQVKKFVFISTDKAINPTNVMGATKRVAELYIQNINENQTYPTKFITTRFGNVLGSNGSVVPLFKKQIEEGGPVIVTHPDITRYFMTIPEACNLVLEAGSMGENGQILVFDMGQSVKIKDLAYKMIRLMGLEPGKDIKIEYSGLRPGEKLHEEVISSLEENQLTHHEKILISKSGACPSSCFYDGISNMEEAIYNNDRWAVVKQLKLLVPEYISNNSTFEVLDTKNPMIRDKVNPS